MLTGSGTTYTAKFESSGTYLNISNNSASTSITSNYLTFKYNNTGYWNISYNDYYLNNLGDTTAAAVGGIVRLPPILAADGQFMKSLQEPLPRTR